MNTKHLLARALIVVASTAIGASALVVALPILAYAQENYLPPSGYVPDAATAIAIARAVLIPIYGEKTIRSEEPLVATRDGSAWLVNGTLPCQREYEHTPCLGGTAFVKLSAEDGQIMFVTHGK